MGTSSGLGSAGKYGQQSWQTRSTVSNPQEWEKALKSKMGNRTELGASFIFKGLGQNNPFGATNGTVNYGGLDSFNQNQSMAVPTSNLGFGGLSQSGFGGATAVGGSMNWMRNIPQYQFPMMGMR